MTINTDRGFRRLRFRANYPDYRAMIWPPLGPYWCSGWAGDESYSIVVAYWPADQMHRLKEFWPEAILDPEDFDDERYARPEFSDRFRCPDYWDEADNCVKPEIVAKYPRTAG